MRLIDADEFKKQISGMVIVNNYSADKANKLCELIDNQPTAYDVDKVVERLEKSSTDEDGVILYVDNKPVITKEIVIKIVKSGGIE